MKSELLGWFIAGASVALAVSLQAQTTITYSDGQSREIREITRKIILQAP